MTKKNYINSMSVQLQRLLMVMAAIMMALLTFTACLEDENGDDPDVNGDGDGENSEIVGGTIKLTGVIYHWDSGHPGAPNSTAFTPLKVADRFTNYNSPIYFNESYSNFENIKGEGGISNSNLDFTVTVEKLGSKIISLFNGQNDDLKYTPENTQHFQLQSISISAPWDEFPHPTGCLERWSVQSISGNTCTASVVHYIYEDRDVTITGKEKTIAISTYKAINVTFKKGWNEFYEEYVWHYPGYEEVITFSNKPFASTYYWVVDG